MFSCCSGPTQPIGLFKYFRWHLAITLINNPSLIHLRKRPAVSLDEEVTMQNGELKTVAIGAEGGAQHNMMPHMVEVSFFALTDGTNIITEIGIN